MTQTHIVDLATRLRRIVGIVKRDERLLGFDADKCIRGRAAIAAGRRMLDRLREEAAARPANKGIVGMSPEDPQYPAVLVQAREQMFNPQNRIGSIDERASDIVTSAIFHSRGDGVPVPFVRVLSSKLVPSKRGFGMGASARLEMFDGKTARFECSKWLPFDDAWSHSWKDIDGGSPRISTIPCPPTPYPYPTSSPSKPLSTSAGILAPASRCAEIQMTVVGRFGMTAATAMEGMPYLSAVITQPAAPPSSMQRNASGERHASRWMPTRSRR